MHLSEISSDTVKLLTMGKEKGRGRVLAGGREPSVRIVVRNCRCFKKMVILTAGSMRDPALKILSEKLFLKSQSARKHTSNKRCQSLT